MSWPDPSLVVLSHKLLKWNKLLNCLDCRFLERIEISHVDVQFLDVITIFCQFTLNPRISLRTSYVVLLTILDTPENAPAVFDGNETPCASYVSHLTNVILGAMSEIEIHGSLRDILRLAEITEN